MPGFASSEPVRIDWDAYKQSFADVNKAASAAGWTPKDFSYQNRVNLPFSMNQGTDYLSQGRAPREATGYESALIQAKQVGDVLSNLPAEALGAISGDEKVKEAFTFNADKLFSGDIGQLGNLAISLPGQLIGAPISGAATIAGEAIGGVPISEAENRKGTWYVPDYEMDASQRVAAGLSGAIDIAGSAFGASGRVFGQVGKSLAKQGLKRSFYGHMGERMSDDVAENIIKNGFGASPDVVKEAAKQMGSKELAKSAKWLSRARNVESMSQGWASRAFKPVGTGGQIVADMVEEGGEESFQQLMDDIRNKQVDENTPLRMLQAGAVGAIGGGMMSGGLALGRRLKGNDPNAPQNRENPQSAEQDPQSSLTVPKDYYSMRRDEASMLGQSDPIMDQHILDKYGEDSSQRTPGMFNAKVIADPQDRAKTNQILLPFRQMFDMYHNDTDDGKSKARLAGLFVDRAELAKAQQLQEGSEERIKAEQAVYSKAMQQLDQIMSAQNDESQQENYIRAFNAVRDHVRKQYADKSTRLYVSGIRAPHTDTDSELTLELADVVDGGAIHLATGVYSMFNGDLDGDAWQILQNQNAKFNTDKLPTNMMMGMRAVPESAGNAQLDTLVGRNTPQFGSVKYGWKEAGFSDASVNMPFDEIVDAFASEINNESLATEYAKRFQEAWADYTEGKPEQLLSELFMEISHNIDSDVAQNVLYRLRKTAAVYSQLSNMTDGYKSHQQVIGETSNTEVNPNMKNRQHRGSLAPGTSMPIQNARLIGWMFFPGANSSGSFRTDQFVGWVNKEFPLYNDFFESTDERGNRERWVSQLLHTLDSSKNPSEAIEGLFWSTTRMQLFKRLGIFDIDAEGVGVFTNRKIGDPKDGNIDIDEFEKVFSEVFNSQTKFYNDALKEEGVFKDFFPPDSPLKVELPNRNDPKFKSVMSRQLYRMIEDWSPEILFGNVPENMKLYTMGELAHMQASPYGQISAFTLFGNSIGENGNKILDNLARTVKQEAVARGDTLISSVHEYAQNLATLITRDNDGNVVVPNAFIQEKVLYEQLLRDIIGLDTCLRYGWRHENSLLNSRYGEFFTGPNTTANSILRGLIAIKLGDTFMEYTTAMSGEHPDAVAAYRSLYDISSSNQVIQHIIDWLDLDSKDDSELNEVDLEFKKSRPVSGDELLRILLDPHSGNGMSFADICTELNSYFNMDLNPGEIASYLLADARMDEEMSLTDLSRRMRDANSKLSTAMRKSAFHNIEDVRAISNYAMKAGTQQAKQQVMDAAKYWALEAADESNSDLMVAAIYNQLSLVGEAPEKAKAELAAALNYQEVAAVNGYFAGNFLNQIGYAIGAVSMNDALSLRSIVSQAIYNPDYHKTISINGKVIEITQAELFAAYDVDISQGVNFDQIFGSEGLFEKAPQLLNWTMPIKWIPGSSSEPVLIPSRTKSPLDRIVEYERTYIGALPERQSKAKILNDICMRQDITKVLSGVMGSDVTSLAANPREWTKKAKRSINKIVDEIYYQMALDENQRKDYYNSMRSDIGADASLYLTTAMNAVREHLNDAGNRARSQLNRMEYVQEEFELQRYRQLLIERLNASDPNINIQEDETQQLATLQGRVAELDTTRVQAEMTRMRTYYGYVHDLMAAMRMSSIQTFSERNIIQQRYEDVISDIEETYGVTVSEDIRRELSQEHVRPIPSDIDRVSDTVLFIQDNANDVWEKINRFVNSDTIKDYKDALPNEQELKNIFNYGTEESKQEIVNAWNSYILEEEVSKMLTFYSTGSSLGNLAANYDAINWYRDTVNHLLSIGITSTAPISTSQHVPPSMYFGEENMILTQRGEFALQSGGVSTMSGRDAGAYQWATALGLAPDNTDCGIEPQEVTLAELQQYFDNGGVQVNIRYKNNDGTLGNRVALTNGVFGQHAMEANSEEWVNSFVAYMPHRCLNGCCCNCGPTAISPNHAGDYIPGRYFVAELLYALSENRVFKSKKRLGAFSTIFHTAWQNSVLENRLYDIQNIDMSNASDAREKLIEARSEYVQELASYYEAVFEQEQIDDIFGPRDALMLAQMTTPFARVRLSDGSYIAIDNSWLRSDVQFQEQLDNFAKTHNNVKLQDFGFTEIKPITLSLIDVMKKWNRDYMQALPDYETSKGTYELSEDERNTFWRNCTDDWSDAIGNREDLRAFTSRYSTVNDSLGYARIATSQSLSPMQAYANSAGVSTARNVTIEESINSAENMTRDQKDSYLRTYNFYFNQTNLFINDFWGDINSDALSPNKKKMYKEFKQLKNSNRYLEGALNTVIVDGITKPSSLAKYLDSLVTSPSNLEAKQVLIPDYIWNNLISNEEYSRFRLGLTASVIQTKPESGVSERYVLYNPTVFGTEARRNTGATSSMLAIDPLSIIISLQDFGKYCTDDSGSVIFSNLAGRKMLFDDYFTMSAKDMFANVPGAKGGGVISVVHDPNELAKIRDIVNSQKEGNYDQYSNKRVFMPKYGQTYKISDSLIYDAIDRYYDKIDSKNSEGNSKNGVVYSNVGNRDVIGWMKREVGGIINYVPIIPNKGSKVQTTPSTISFNTLYLDESALSRGEIVFSFRSELDFNTILSDDGIKEYFTDFAWKSFATLNPEVRGPSLGWDYDIQVQGGKKVKAEVGQVYSGTTEKSRLVYSRQMLIQNLCYLNLLTKHNFFGQRSDITRLDTDRFKGMSSVDLESLTNPNDFRAWEKFREGTIYLDEDPVVNNSLRKFVGNILDASNGTFTPFHVFSSLERKPGSESFDQINYYEFDFNLFFKDMTKDDVLRVFNAINPSLCFKDSNSDFTKTHAQHDENVPMPMVNSDGWILTKIDPNTKMENSALYMKKIQSIGDNYCYCPGHVQPSFFHDESTLIGIPSTRGKYGSQNSINSSLESGVHGTRKVQNILDYMFVKQDGRYLYAPNGRLNSVYDEDGNLRSANMSDEEFNERWRGESLSSLIENNASRKTNYRYNSYRRHRERVVQDGIETFSRSLNINASDEFSWDDVKNVRNNLRKAFAGDASHPRALTDEEIDMLYKCAALFSYNGGVGKWSEGVTAKQYCEVIRTITDNFTSHPSQFFINGGETIKNAGDRVYNPVLVSGISRRIFEQPLVNKAWNNDFDAFTDAQIGKDGEIYDQTCRAIGKRSSVAQRRASWDMLEFILITNQKEDISNWLEDGISIQDLMEAATTLNDTLAQFSDNVIDKRVLEDGKNKTQEMLRKARNREKNMVQSVVDSSTKPGGESRRYTFRNRMSNFSVVKTLTNVSRINALLEPELWGSAILQKGYLQGQTKLGMVIQAKLKVGPRDMGERTLFNKKAKQNLRAFREDDQVREVWKALKSVQWNQDDIIFLSDQADSAESLIKLAKERSEEKTKLEKFTSRVYKLSGGGDTGIGTQLEIWAEDMFQRLQLKGDPVWTHVRPDGLTEFEHQLAENPAGLLVHFMTADSGNNANLMEARQAFNVAREGEFACETAEGAIITEAFRRSPFSEFVFATGVCRFPHYSINASKFFLRNIGPVSTLTYVFNEHLAEKENIYNEISKESGKDVNWKIAGADMTNMSFERFQKQKNLKEALLIDAMNIGVRAIGLLIIASVGVFEPPDDERFWGNLEEWTLCGFRLKENWWIQDILGPVLAQCACFRSAELGKPRPDILINWLGNAMYSNPLLKVADVASMLIDPSYDYMQEYEQEAGKFEDAKGGAPSLAEKWHGDVITFGLHYASQFLTPAIVRDLFNTLEPYEHSYKRVYAQNATGVPGEGDKTVKTDYLDARIRQITRKNPVLGWLADFVTRPTTSYYQGGSPFAEYAMPLTLTPDQAQLAAVAEFSLTNNDGTEKTEAEKKTVALKVIGILSSTDDIEQLAHDGFMINYETREYVSKQLNDLRKDLENQYDLWVQETGLDYYIIGDGDWNEGARLKEETTSKYYDDLAYINGIYRKLWDDSLKYGPEYYNRYNTSYARDVNGNIYATGYRPGFGPFLTAPGDTRNPGNTMGREHSWVTPSAVVYGESAGDRALIPADREAVATPQITDWAKDKNNGYSDLRRKDGTEISLENMGLGIGEALEDIEDNDKSGKKTSSGYGSRGGSGRGGRSGGSGGGGRSGGSAPRIYASNATVNPVSPSRLMNSDRIQNTSDISYLRPGFETKGSHEAYKRGDI